MQKLIHWRSQMQSDLDCMNGTINDQTQEIADFEHSTIERLDLNAEGTSDGPVVKRILKTPVYNDNLGFSAALIAVSCSSLNNDQKNAYDIILWHLKQTLLGKRCALLWMIIHREGGTGNQKCFQSVTEAFHQHGAHHMLLKAAYTGVAASLIVRKTTHVIGGVSLLSLLSSARDKTLSDKAKAKLEMFWKPIKYLFVDEMSMLAKDFFAFLSHNASIGKKDLNDSSFRGVHVVILGDFHQFPPVAYSIQDALYYPSNAETDSFQSQIGHAVYEEFQMVVTLKEQK